MDYAIAKRWVKALRSGRYKQGQVKLRQGDKHCCLGVLCRILRTPYTIRADGTFLYDNAARFLPVSVMDKIHANSWTKPTRVMNSSLVPVHQLAKLNDEGATFAEIADVIEASWKDI